MDATPDILSSLARIEERLARLESALGSTALEPMQEPAPAPLLLSLPQAARLSGVGVDTLRAWVRTGRLPRRAKGEGRRRPTFLTTLDEVRAATRQGRQ